MDTRTQELILKGGYWIQHEGTSYEVFYQGQLIAVRQTEEQATRTVQQHKIRTLPQKTEQR